MWSINFDWSQTLKNHSQPPYIRQDLSDIYEYDAMWLMHDAWLNATIPQVDGEITAPSPWIIEG